MAGKEFWRDSMDNVENLRLLIMVLSKGVRLNRIIILVIAFDISFKI